VTRRTIVLDANILIRAVLEERVRRLVADHVAEVSFFAPDAAYAEAREHLPALLEKRGVRGSAALATLDALEAVVRPVEAELYRPLKQRALARISERDPDD
jgi:predicted nucleic acid-binding protein